MFILKEYMNNLSLSGQPGPGDAFLKWVWQHQSNEIRCARVHITEDASREFLEFPEAESLRQFDRSDRKFVAVALTSAHRPEILNAVDSDWWHHRHALKACGIHIQFLCPKQFAEKK
jgi:hypothetical protein